MLHQLCNDLLGSKPTTLESDMASLEKLKSGQSHKVHAMLALKFRIGKKQLLQSCVWQYDPQQFQQQSVYNVGPQNK